MGNRTVKVIKLPECQTIFIRTYSARFYNEHTYIIWICTKWICAGTALKSGQETFNHIIITLLQFI